MRKTDRTTLFVVAVVMVLVTNQFLSFDPPEIVISRSSKSVSESGLANERQKEMSTTLREIGKRRPLGWEASKWSAYRRQHHKNTTEFDALVKWKPLGSIDHADYSPKRAASEILTYGLAGVFPWYGYRLPAMRFNAPFTNSTQVEMVMVEGVVDVFLDLHHCSKGRDGENGPDGYYDACFPNVTGRKAAQSLCFEEGKHMANETRLRHFPFPGHERWSCSDHQVIEQLVGAQVIDYLMRHGDRFYARRTNNLFFSLQEKPLTFVSIDHDLNICKFFKSAEYDERVKLDMLKEYSLPPELYDEIRAVVLGSKEEFERRLNDVIDGQLDNVERVLDGEFLDSCPGNEKPKSTTDMIWDRLQSVARFYKMNTTINDGN